MLFLQPRDGRDPRITATGAGRDRDGIKAGRVVGWRFERRWIVARIFAFYPVAAAPAGSAESPSVLCTLQLVRWRGNVGHDRAPSPSFSKDETIDPELLFGYFLWIQKIFEVDIAGTYNVEN